MSSLSEVNKAGISPEAPGEGWFLGVSSFQKRVRGFLNLQVKFYIIK